MPHKCTACGRQFADGSKEMLSGCPDCGGTKFQFMPAGGAPAAEEPPDPPSRERGTVAETIGTATTKLRDFVGDDPGPPTPGEPSAAGGSPSTGESPGAGGAVDATDTDAGPAQSTASSPPTESGPAREPDDDASDPASSSPENGAQSAARSEMVTQEELPGGSWPSVGRPAGPEDEDGPGAVQGPDTPAGSVAERGVEGPTTEMEPEGRVVDTPSEDQPDLEELRAELNDQFEGIRITSPGQYELNLMELYEREETIIALQENGRYVIEPPEAWHGNDE